MSQSHVHEVRLVIPGGPTPEAPAPESSHARLAPAAISREEARAYIGVSLSFLDDEIRRGAIRAARLGRRVVILKADLDRYLEERAGNGAAGERRSAGEVAA